jgi:hypothetical protein
MIRNPILWSLVLLVLALKPGALAQDAIQVYASGFVRPIGLTFDARGNLWVAEQGTGSGNTSRVSVVTADRKVHPFLTGIPSNIPAFEPIGCEHVAFDINGKMLVLSGAWGTGPEYESLIVMDTTGFTPGGPAHTIADRDTSFRLGDYVRSRGGTPNPYRILVLPDGDVLIVDASYNGIIRRSRSSGALSDFCLFPPSGQIDVVPTGIAYDGQDFYIGTLTGLPVPKGAAKVYKINASGVPSAYAGGFTAIVDIARNPVDGTIAVLKHGDFGPPWLNNSGALYRINKNMTVDTLVAVLNRPSGMAFNPTGDLFVSSFGDNNILKISNITTDVALDRGTTPKTFALDQNYPNPFNPSTIVRYELPEAGNVKLTVYDLLGREVSVLVDARMEKGVHETRFEATRLAAGTYIYALRAGSQILSRKMTLLK